MSYTMDRAIPKTPNPYVRHATDENEALRLLDRQVYDEMRYPENGYGQSEYIQRIEATTHTSEQYNFKVYISGD